MEDDQFTLDEANSLIPWLAERFRKIDTLRQEYAILQKRIADFRLTGGNASDTPWNETTAEHITRQIEDGVDEILDQGIIVRDVARGLVDFPSLQDDRDIYLCWIDGEEQVKYWHEIDQGFSHRQPI